VVHNEERLLALERVLLLFGGRFIFHGSNNNRAEKVKKNTGNVLAQQCG